LLALVLFAFAPALTWTAARLLNGEKASAILVLAPPLITLGVYFVGFVPAQVQMAISLGLTAIYTLAAAWELARNLSGDLKARWPLVTLITVHGSIFVVGTVEALRDTIPVDSPPPLTSWFGLVHLEILLFVIGTAIFVSAFTRERTEIGLKA